MAHEIESMFSVKETPWHSLGIIIQEAPTTLEAIRLAGLDWQVDSKPIYWENGQVNKIQTHKAIVRSDNHSILGVVGKEYMPLQNSEAFSFFDDFVKSGECSFETAGSLRQGKRVWILAKINKDPIDITGKGDLVRKFLLLSNGHDGITSVRVGFSPIRVVCANTLAMAHSNQNSALIRVKHSKRVQFRLDQIKEIINLANESFEATAEQYKKLASKDVNQKDIEKYVKQVFRLSDIDTIKRTKSKDELTGNIIRLFETGKGNDRPGTRGTYWALYNSVTEYLSYEKKGNEESRLNNLWFGTSKEINSRALDTALIMAS